MDKNITIEDIEKIKQILNSNHIRILATFDENKRKIENYLDSLKSKNILSINDDFKTKLLENPKIFHLIFKDVSTSEIYSILNLNFKRYDIFSEYKNESKNLPFLEDRGKYLIYKKKPERINKFDFKMSLRDRNKVIEYLGPSFECNNIQKMIFRSLYYKRDNSLICAPTGTGKSFAAVFAIMGEINIYSEKVKCIYIAPMKALASEVKNRLKKIFKNLNIEILTGDYKLSKERIEESNIIIATPEKIDLLIRKGYTNFSLLIIDEIHILNEKRGGLIESIVAFVNYKGLARIIGLSATLPNFIEIANFLRVEKENLFYFDESFRQIPIEYEFLFLKTNSKLKISDIDENYEEKSGEESDFICKNDLKEDNNPIYETNEREEMNNLLIEKIIQNIENSTIVFLHSRKETLSVANFIFEKIKQNELIGTILRKIKKTKVKLGDKNLDELLKYGISIHHAGLENHIREKIENLYKNQSIHILISTATLAWGVNLPASLVIIRGTELNKYESLPEISIRQMFGRAGRFEKGKCILITRNQNYLSSFNDLKPIISHLHLTLPNYINGFKFKNDLEIKNWYSFTLAFIQYKNNEEIIKDAILKLKLSNFIIEENDGYNQTKLGEIASNFYLDFKEAEFLYKNIEIDSIDENILKLFEYFNISLSLEGLIELENPYKNNILRIMNSIFEISILKKYSATSKIIFKLLFAIKNKFYFFQNPLRIFSKNQNFDSTNELNFLELKIIKEIENLNIPFHIFKSFNEIELKKYGFLKKYLNLIPEIQIKIENKNFNENMNILKIIIYENSIDIIENHNNFIIKDGKYFLKNYHIFISDSLDNLLFNYSKYNEIIVEKHPIYFISVFNDQFNIEKSLIYFLQ